MRGSNVLAVKGRNSAAEFEMLELKKKSGIQKSIFLYIESLLIGIKIEQLKAGFPPLRLFEYDFIRHSERSEESKNCINTGFFGRFAHC